MKQKPRRRRTRKQKIRSQQRRWRRELAAAALSGALPNLVDRVLRRLPNKQRRLLTRTGNVLVNKMELYPYYVVSDAVGHTAYVARWRVERG